MEFTRATRIRDRIYNAQDCWRSKHLQYQRASLYLYNTLIGERMEIAHLTPERKYIFRIFKPNMLSPADQTQNVQLHSGSVRKQLRLLDDSSSNP